MTKGDFIGHDLEETRRCCLILTTCAVHMDLIRKSLYQSRFLSIKPEAIKQCVQRADRLGADRSSTMFLQSVRAVFIASEEAWEHKLQALCALGFSEDDILRIFRKEPRALAGSLEKITTIKQVLLDTGKYTMKSIISCPRALMTSVEKKYKPRLSVLGVLERKNLIKQWPSLSFLCKSTDDQFRKKFVAPLINEISDVWPNEASE